MTSFPLQALKSFPVTRTRSHFATATSSFASSHPKVRAFTHIGPRAAQFSVPASGLLTHTCTSHPCTQICTPASALSTAQSIAVSSPTQVILIFTLVVLPVLGWLCCYCSTSVLSLFFHVFHFRTISLASLAYTALSYYLSPLLPAEFLNSCLFCFLTEDFTASTRSFFFSLALSFCGNLSPNSSTLVHQLSQHVPSARDDRFPFLP